MTSTLQKFVGVGIGLGMSISTFGVVALIDPPFGWWIVGIGASVVWMAIGIGSGYSDELNVK